MDIRWILLSALAMPEYARIEYWINCQKESGYSETAFCNFLTDQLLAYKNSIDRHVKEFNIMGNQVTDYGIPLLFETNQRLNGHIGNYEVFNLAAAIQEFRKSLGIYQFKDFKELFADANATNADLPKGGEHYHSYQFNEYIKSRFGAETLETQYSSFLTRKRFFEYLNFSKEQFNQEQAFLKKETEEFIKHARESESYIKPELHTRLNNIESYISKKITEWKSGQGKIQCATFCELLFERNYFIKGSTRIKSLTSFALNRYGLDIEIQLGTTKSKDRQKHRAFFINKINQS